MDNHLQVTVRQKDKLVWQGSAESLSSTNAVGPFDILPEHANFIGLVEKQLIIRFQNTKKEWPIDKGIISVKNNTVEVYLGY